MNKETSRPGKEDRFYSKQEAASLMNRLGAEAKPFLFIIDYLMKAIRIEKLPLSGEGILFSINGYTNAGGHASLQKPLHFSGLPVPRARYRSAFAEVMDQIKRGNSYLVNLTQPSDIETNLSLKEIFYCSRAPYKLLVDGSFVVFSPETFITIDAGVIAAHPMKGTIDAATPGADQIILADAKEKAEHMTIVDLIRNDLSMVAREVRVKRLRYLQHIVTSYRNLWQVSSEITGQLPPRYPETIGDILFRLLPAGSVTGAPKPQTLSIIQSAEKYERGYYTGVFGYFDGRNLDSGVMIRFIEKQGSRLVYKSGGGITCNSVLETEYEELKNKIYVPFY